MGIIAIVLLVALVVAGRYILILRKDRDRYITLTDAMLLEGLRLTVDNETLRTRNRGLRNGNVNLFRENERLEQANRAAEFCLEMVLADLERTA